MKIGVDICSLSILNDKAGLYQYTYNLVSNLLAIDLHDKYTLLSHIRGFKGDERIKSCFIRKRPGRILELFLERMAVPLEFLVGPVDVFHGPCFFIPRSIGCKTVVTIHDLMAVRHPEFLKPEWSVSIRKKICLSAKRADAVITVSNFSKEEMIELLNISGDRIRVVYNGIAQGFRCIKDRKAIERVVRKYGAKAPYLLFVGTIEPKKNLETLIRASVELRNSTAYKYPLLIAGKKGYGFQSVWNVVQELHAEGDTIFTDMVDDGDLPYLYNGAELFVFPSLSEGFGIPVIEAMACGVPVVASNLTSIPEIAGDAALLINPLNIEEMAGAMHDVLSNSALRKQLVEKGLQRARDFSWERTARETLKLYQELG